MQTIKTEYVNSMSEEFSALMSRLVKKVYSIDRNEKFCFGVTVPQCYTIEALYQTGPVSMLELSGNLGLAVSTLTRMIDILARDGIVKRRRSAEDRRKVLVELTEKGRDLYLKLKKCTLSYTNDILKNIPEHRIEDVIDSIKLLIFATEGFDLKCCKREIEG